jgi:hypothetical protein
MDDHFICRPAGASDGECKCVVVGVPSRVSLDAKRLAHYATGSGECITKCKAGRDQVCTLCFLDNFFENQTHQIPAVQSRTSDRSPHCSSCHSDPLHRDKRTRTNSNHEKREEMQGAPTRYNSLALARSTFLIMTPEKVPILFFFPSPRHQTRSCTNHNSHTIATCFSTFASSRSTFFFLFDNTSYSTVPPRHTKPDPALPLELESAADFFSHQIDYEEVETAVKPREGQYVGVAEMMARRLERFRLDVSAVAYQAVSEINVRFHVSAQAETINGVINPYFRNDGYTIEGVRTHEDLFTPLFEVLIPIDNPRFTDTTILWLNTVKYLMPVDYRDPGLSLNMSKALNRRVVVRVPSEMLTYNSLISRGALLFPLTANAYNLDTQLYAPTDSQTSRLFNSSNSHFLSFVFSDIAQMYGLSMECYLSFDDQTPATQTTMLFYNLRRPAPLNTLSKTKLPVFKVGTLAVHICPLSDHLPTKFTSSNSHINVYGVWGRDPELATQINIIIIDKHNFERVADAIKKAAGAQIPCDLNLFQHKKASATARPEYDEFGIPVGRAEAARPSILPLINKLITTCRATQALPVNIVASLTQAREAELVQFVLTCPELRPCSTFLLCAGAYERRQPPVLRISQLKFESAYSPQLFVATLGAYVMYSCSLAPPSTPPPSDSAVRTVNTGARVSTPLTPPQTLTSSFSRTEAPQRGGRGQPGARSGFCHQENQSRRNRDIERAERRRGSWREPAHLISTFSPHAHSIQDRHRQVVQKRPQFPSFMLCVRCCRQFIDAGTIKIKGCFICFRLTAPPLLSHRAMHALNGNIDHPQQIDINAFPARPFLPIVIEKITASRINTPTPSSTTIADFENELAKTNPDSAASLQRDAITPNKKSKKKNKNKKKIAPPPSNANATVVHFNMNLGGVESAIHFLRKFSKRYANKTLIVNLVETGLQTTEETKSLTTFAAEIGFSCSHVFLSAEESNLIWKLRKMKKNKPTNQPKTPRRGGISTFWNAPLKDPIICKDESKHWQSLTFAHNGHALKVIALYNNNSAAVSPHPYDAQTGDEIIANDIAPLVTKHTIILADANQTKNDKTHRNPAKPSHKQNALNDLLSKSDLTDAIAHITPEPQFTYTKKHTNGPVSSVIDYILVPQTFVDGHRIHDGGLIPTSYRPALDDAPTAPLQHAIARPGL